MRYTVLLVLLLLTVAGNAQMIFGKVLSEKGLAASSIKVQFINKANTVVTNPDGTFKILATKLPDTLIFSAPGVEPYKVVVTEKTLADPNFEIVLLDKREKLEDVAVYDYTSTATASKADRFLSSAGTLPGGEVVMKRSEGTFSDAYTGDKAYTAGDAKKLFLKDTLVERGTGFRTRLVTAGEINDFTKWTMWQDFTTAAFKQHCKEWKLYLRQRYCVQVQNKERVAVNGLPVYLLNNATHDTVWKSMTDNTGKAELWAAGRDSSIQNNNYSIVCNGQRMQAIAFTQGINNFTMALPCYTSNDVDIAFVVDATGSMGDEIEYLKLELEDVLRNTFEKYNTLNFRAASVFYRDMGDEYLTRNTGFNSNLLKVLNFIKLQKADGGGDGPEAVQTALKEAVHNLEWNSNARARLLLLILDAPPHREDADSMYVLMQQAAAKGIRIIPIVCSGATKETEFLMRSLALATNGTYAFLTNHSGVGGNHIQPTTDAFTVELLNDLLQRVIQQMIFQPDCGQQAARQPEPVIQQPGNLLQIKVSPNPTTGRFTITCNKALKELFVTDFTGKILMRITDKGNKKEVNISTLPAGTYLIKYVTQENEWGTEKIVLVH
jgi:hypothetical protein